MLIYQVFNLTSVSRGVIYLIRTIDAWHNRFNLAINVASLLTREVRLNINICSIELTTTYICTKWSATVIEKWKENLQQILSGCNVGVKFGGIIESISKAWFRTLHSQ